MIEPAQEQGGAALAAANPDGDWVVTLDVDERPEQALSGELAVRALSAVVAGTRTYVAARAYGYSFTVILSGVGAQAALGQALGRLESAQLDAGLPVVGVVCAEVTLVGVRPVPAGASSKDGCDNSAP
jgi:hypothetical protein